MTCLARAARNSVGLHFKLFRKGFPDENFYLFQAMKAYAFNEPLAPWKSHWIRIANGIFVECHKGLLKATQMKTVNIRINKLTETQ